MVNLMRREYHMDDESPTTPTADVDDADAVRMRPTTVKLDDINHHGQLHEDGDGGRRQ